LLALALVYAGVNALVAPSAHPVVRVLFLVALGVLFWSLDGRERSEEVPIHEMQDAPPRTAASPGLRWAGRAATVSGAALIVGVLALALANSAASKWFLAAAAAAFGISATLLLVNAWLS
jgi:hypothetical protein